jgi:hypothetical protein
MKLGALFLPLAGAVILGAPHRTCGGVASRPVFPIVRPLANTTLPFALPVCVGVSRCERMPANALRLPRVESGRAESTQHVHAAGDGFHVPRIAARAIAAEMIEREFGRDRLEQKFVSRSVRLLLSPIQSNLDVSLSRRLGRINPTRVGVNSALRETFKKSLFDRHIEAPNVARNALTREMQ